MGLSIYVSTELHRKEGLAIGWDLYLIESVHIDITIPSLSEWVNMMLKKDRREEMLRAIEGRDTCSSVQQA